MRYLHTWLAFMVLGKPSGYLSRRQVFCQPFGHEGVERFVQSQLTLFRPPCSLNGDELGGRCTIALYAAVLADLTADC